MKKQDLIALILIVGVGFVAGGMYLQSTITYHQVYNTLAELSLPPVPEYSEASAQTALESVGVPFYSGAQRLTFNDAEQVSYRIAASANVIADFYQQDLSAQGWEELTNEGTFLTYAKAGDELDITLKENPLSQKTVVTYAFAPMSAVLGVKIAQESTPPPASGGSGEAGAGGCSGPTPPTPCNNGHYECSGDNWQCVTNSQPNQNTQQNQYQQPNQPMQPGQFNQPNQPMQPNQFAPSNNNGQDSATTCRVNGVDMPGPCSNYNQGGGQGQPGFGDNGQKGEGQMNQGPSEEEMQKMDEQRFKQMKQGLNQFAKGVTMMKKNVARMKTRVAKCGVSIPEELANAMSSADSIVAKIKAAQSADELDAVIGDIEDIGAIMQDWGPRLGQLDQLCQMMKQGDRDTKQLERDAKRLESRVKANKKLDLTAILSQFKNNIASLKGVFLGVVALAKTDPESALEKLQDEYYGEMDNIQSSRMAIETALNVSQGLKTAASDIKKVESQIKSLQKKKVDTSAAEDLLATMKSQVADLQQFIKGTFDPEELIIQVEDAYQTRAELNDLLQELGGGTSAVPQIKGYSGMNVNMNLPDAFQKHQPQDNGGMGTEPGPGF